MKSLWIVGAVVVCLLGLQSCGSTGVPSGSMAAAPNAPVRTCALSNTEGATCFRRGTKRICHLFVGVTTSGDLYVYPHVLHATRGASSDMERTLVWHSVDPRLQFSVSDGPFSFTHPTEFKDGGPTSDPDGAIEPAATKRRYRITYLNTMQVTNNDYHIRAQTQDGIQLSCDPRITNDAD